MATSTPPDPSPQQPRAARLLQRRIARKGLRPRLAASVIALCWVIAVVVFGVAEWLVDRNSFDTGWDGIWWAVQTVTTVGYGDVVPQGTAGQVVASVLMLGGLSLLAVVTATVTSAFVTRAEADRRAAGRDPVMQKLEEISSRVDELSAELARARSGD
jgi:voltage-gated potassium channel